MFQIIFQCFLHPFLPCLQLLKLIFFYFDPFDEKEKNNIINKQFKSENYNITRFKGLGEMPADQLKETTMDQNKRNLILINSEKAKKESKTTEKLFETLMGKQAELRFKFIQNNANFIKNLDV